MRNIPRIHYYKTKDEEKNMKKKLLVTVIAIVIVVFIAMLFGRGTKTVPTISEFCGKGKHYICLVTNLNKDAKIREMYFFEDGMATVIPGDIYGCKVGDLANMSDKEIWKKYEEVKKEHSEELEDVDLPVKCEVKTDASGNAPREEYVCIPANKEVVYGESGKPLYRGKIIVHYDSERAGVGAEVQIYDKTFFYFDTTNWCYYLTTETIKMDDVKNKNCIVDPNSQETNEMFKDYFESK